jgi:chromate transporter
VAGSRSHLGEVARLFTRLGFTAFGGPAGHLSLMEQEIVHRRHWMSQAEFLDLVAASNLIPGPNSTELAIHVGYRRARWPGLLVAGACFILPGCLLTLAAAWAYVRFGSLPAVTRLLDGVKPVMLAIILHALWRMGRTAARTWRLGLVALVAAGANLRGANELLLLLLAGLVVMALESGASWRKHAAAILPAWPVAVTGGGVGGAGAAAGAAAAYGLAPLFLFFLKVGAVLFGSGYVLLAFLRADLVERWHWLSETQLLDAIAIGQATPGPLFSTATFIGYLLGGIRGATAATLGIFLPAFVFVAASGPIVPRLRRLPAAGAFLDGVIAASLALMAVVTLHIGREAIHDPLTLALAAGCLLFIWRTRVPSTWLILAGAVAGLAIPR